MNASVFRALIEEQANDVRSRTYEAPFNSDSFFWTGLAPRSGFADADGISPLSLDGCVTCRVIFDENIANMRAGLARGFSIPRVTLAGRDADDGAVHGRRRGQPALRAVHAHAGRTYRRAADAAAKRRSGGDPGSGSAGLPRLHAMFVGEDYMPRARTTIAARDLPDGEAYYRAQMLRKYTTLELTPRARSTRWVSARSPAFAPRWKR